MDFDHELAIHKEGFIKWKALIVLDDKAMRRYVLCWGPMLVQRLSDWPTGDSLADLWACVSVDFKALAELTGDSPPQVMANFRQAQGLQLIYPDGSVAVAAASILKKQVDELTRS